MARRTVKSRLPSAITHGDDPMAAGSGDPLDREIDAAVRQGRPARGMDPAARAAATSMRRSGGSLITRIHPETGEPIGVGDGSSARPSAGFSHAQAEANQAMEENVPGMPNAGDGPAAVLRSVRAHAPEYSEEYELKLYGRMHHRNMGLNVIAATLGVSVRTVYNKRNKWLAQVANQAANFDMNEHIGETVSFYKDVAGSLMRFHDNAKEKTHTRISAGTAAVQVINNLNQFLAMSGVFAAHPYVPAAGKTSGLIEGGDFLRKMERALMGGIDQIDTVFAVDEAEIAAQDNVTAVRVY